MSPRGKVTASVQGSRTKPYRVFIEIRLLTAVEWDAAEAVMASRASFMASSWPAICPIEIEEAFAESSGTLFPASADGFDFGVLVPGLGEPV